MYGRATVNKPLSAVSLGLSSVIYVVMFRYQQKSATIRLTKK